MFSFQTIDKTGKAGQFEDLSSVEKYEMDEADYAKRSGIEFLAECLIRRRMQNLSTKRHT